MRKIVKLARKGLLGLPNPGGIVSAHFRNKRTEINRQKIEEKKNECK